MLIIRNSCFGQKSNNAWLKRQDYITKAAVLMADPELEFNDRYYRSRAFIKGTLSVWERAHQAAEALSRQWAPPIRSEAKAAPEKDIYDSSTTWEDCFNLYPTTRKCGNCCRMQLRQSRTIWLSNLTGHIRPNSRTGAEAVQGLERSFL